MAAYRRDLEGVGRRIAADAEVGVLHLDWRDRAATAATGGRQDREENATKRPLWDV